MTRIRLDELFDSMMSTIKKDFDLLERMDRKAGIDVWLQILSDTQARIHGFKKILINLQHGYYMPDEDKEYLESIIAQLHDEYSKTFDLQFINEDI